MSCGLDRSLLSTTARKPGSMIVIWARAGTVKKAQMNTQKMNFKTGCFMKTPPEYSPMDLDNFSIIRPYFQIVLLLLIGFQKKKLK
jgi:hypothetical protein